MGQLWRTKQSSPLPLPSIQSWDVCCLLQAQYLEQWSNIAWRGGGGKALFSLFKLAKCYFVTDCSFKILNLNLILTSSKSICLLANLAEWGGFENENLLRCIIGERTGEYGVLGDSCWNSLRHGYLAHSKAFLYTSNEASCKDINPE